MDILKSLTDENTIAEESIIKNLIEKFKKYKKEKKEEKKLTVEEIKARDWSYRKKDYESFIKKAKPIVDKYVKEYPKVFKETFNYSKSEFLTGSEEYVGILTWDLWEFNPEARTNEDKNNEFYALYDKVIFELKDAAPAGYIVAEHGDWDDGLIVLVDADISRAKLKESATESIDLLATLTNEEQIAEEGIKSFLKNKFEKLKEASAKKVAEREAKEEEKYRQIEPYAREFKDTCISLSKKLIKNDQFTLGAYDTPKEMVDETFYFHIIRKKVNYAADICYRSDTDVPKSESVALIDKLFGNLPQGYSYDLISLDAVTITYEGPAPSIGTESIDVLAALTNEE